MDISPTQVGTLVEFFWYAPPFNLVFAGLLLWLALTFGLGRTIESFTSGKLSKRGQRLMPAVAAFLVLLLFSLAMWQKNRTVTKTRQGIANYMVLAGLRDLSFEQIRQTINADYSNNLLLAVGDTNTGFWQVKQRTLRLSILKSLSLKLLDSTSLKKIWHDERLLATTLGAYASQLGQHYPRAVSARRRVGFSFREVDEVVFPKASQLLVIATLRDYPERFYLRPNQSQPQPLDSVYVCLDQLTAANDPLWARKVLVR